MSTRTRFEKEAKGNSEMPIVFSRIAIAKTSTATINRYGESGSPCLPPPSSVK